MAARVELHKEFSKEELSELDANAEQVFNEAYQHYVDKDGWKVNKEGPAGALVYAKKDKAKNKTMFKLEGIAHLDQATFYKKFFSIEEAEDIPKWNSTIQLVQVLKEIDPATHLCYQVTAPTGPGGMVSGRDFILLRRMKVIDGKNVVGYSSSELADIGPVKNFVRGDSGPSCIVVEAVPDDPTSILFTWVVDLELKLSYVPTAIFNQIFQYLLLDNMKAIRERCEKLRNGLVA